MTADILSFEDKTKAFRKYIEKQAKSASESQTPDPNYIQFMEDMMDDLCCICDTMDLATGMYADQDEFRAAQASLLGTAVDVINGVSRLRAKMLAHS